MRKPKKMMAKMKTGGKGAAMGKMMAPKAKGKMMAKPKKKSM